MTPDETFDAVLDRRGILSAYVGCSASSGNTLLVFLENETIREEPRNAVSENEVNEATVRNCLTHLCWALVDVQWYARIRSLQLKKTAKKRKLIQRRGLYAM